MKTQLRLNSVVPAGVGSCSEAISMEVIYTYLLQKYEQNVYSVISINQVGDDLDELILKEPGNKIHINIRYPADDNFDLKSEQEKNITRLAVIHTALLRIAASDKKLDPSKVEMIRGEILEKNFSFEFVRKLYPNKADDSIVGKVVFQPTMKECNYYFIVEKNGNQICRAHIYKSLPLIAYDYDNFFGMGKWKGVNEFILTGKLKEVETIIKIDTCSVEVINLTHFKMPPHYTLMQAGVLDSVRKMALKDFESLIPPESLPVYNDARRRWNRKED